MQNLKLSIAFVLFLFALHNADAQPSALEDNYFSTQQVDQYTMFSDTTEMKRKRINSFWSGLGVGFGVGGTAGIIIGLTGPDWVLDDGSIVPKATHAFVDMFIFAVPTMVMGSVVGVRHPVSTLEPSRLHAQLGFGYSSVKTYKNMIAAFDASGIASDIPHWFGYLHYPNGDESSTPYTWNFAVDYNLSDKFTVGFSFNNMVKQEINEAGLTHVETEQGMIGINEWTKGETYTVLADYVFNPIHDMNKSRLEVAAGVGVGFQNVKIGGSFDTPDSEFGFTEQIFTPYIRTTIDYYSRKTLSLQLKFGYRPKRAVDVPMQTNGISTIQAHSINYRAFEWTVGVRRHFNW